MTQPKSKFLTVDVQYFGCCLVDCRAGHQRKLPVSNDWGPA